MIIENNPKIIRYEVVLSKIDSVTSENDETIMKLRDINGKVSINSNAGVSGKIILFSCTCQENKKNEREDASKAISNFFLEGLFNKFKHAGKNPNKVQVVQI